MGRRLPKNPPSGMAAERFLQLRSHPGWRSGVAVREGRSSSTTRRELMSAQGSAVLQHSHGEDVRLANSASRAKEQLSAIASELLARRDAILEAWRAAGEPAERGIASSLSRAQF